MNDAQILEMVIDALDEVAPGKSELIDGANLNVKISDLDIDSVATMELIGAIEDRLGTTFPDEALAQIATFADLANLIRNAR